MTLLDSSRSKSMSRDMGLIGILRYLPLAQFTKARPVASLVPFSLAIPRNRYCHGSKLPATRSRAAHMKANDNGFESLRDSASPPDTHTPIGSILMETSNAHQQMMYGSSTEDSERFDCSLDKAARTTAATADSSPCATLRVPQALGGY